MGTNLLLRRRAMMGGGGKDWREEFLTFIFDEAGTFSWKSPISFPVNTISVSKNGGEWTQVTSTSSGALLASVEAGDEVRVKGNNNNYATGTGAYQQFVSTASCRVAGNIMSLINGDNFVELSAIPASFAFTGLFRKMTKLYDASELVLPAVTLTEGCYAYMFEGDTSLIAPPALPAMNLAKECYRSMLNECGFSVPPALPAMTLAAGCYNYMFGYCANLVESPVLAAPTLVSDCYKQMFWRCPSISKVTCLAEGTITGTTDWIGWQPATGVFYKKAGVEWPIGSGGIPDGWTVIEV